MTDHLIAPHGGALVNLIASAGRQAELRDGSRHDVDFVLDGGSCPVGVESTIVDCTLEPPQVLRPGGISADKGF